VSERVPPETPAKGKGEEKHFFDPAEFTKGVYSDHEAEYRDAALRIDLETVKVHVIRKVQFQSDDFDVRRHRSTKRESEF